MDLRREPGNLAADDQVNVEIESVGLERFAVPFLHFANFRADIINRLVDCLSVGELLAHRIVFAEVQVLVDQCDCRLRQR